MKQIITQASNTALAAAFVAVAALFSACSTSKNVSKGTAAANTQTTAAVYAKKVTDNFQKTECITAKASVELQSGTKSISLGGNLRMKRDDVIQISMSFLGMEVARIEFSPENVLLIDRFNKQYVKATYADASFLKSANLDFYVLQSMFWNEIFVPGTRDVKSSLDKFVIASSGDHTLLSLTSSPKLDYEFLTKTSDALLDRVTVNPKSLTAKESLVCKYSDFTSFEGKQFPTSISLEAKGGKRDINMTIGLSRLSDSDKWETHTKVPSSYKQRPIDEIMAKLSALQ
jgi:hypothetical protein